MKRTAILILLAAVLLLPSCVRRPQQRMVRTTITRPVVTERYMTRSGATMTTSGMETIDTYAPYESPAYRAAGEALFSNP